MAYLAIDIGGTKTLVCEMTDEGEIASRVRFETPKSYEDFLSVLKSTLSKIDYSEIKSVCVGAPGFIDRTTGSVIEFGNLPWLNSPIQDEVARATGRPTILENDAKLASLYEAHCFGGDHNRVLYITVSTGIGIGLAINGVIDTTISDAGGKSMFFEYNGAIRCWEDFASGKAIQRDFGKQAREIEDSATWCEISERLVVGLTQLITLTSPQIITIGGGVGSHFDKFGEILNAEIEKYLFPKSRKPNIPIVQAKDAEDAVIYGCYHHAKANTNS